MAKIAVFTFSALSMCASFAFSASGPDGERKETFYNLAKTLRERERKLPQMTIVYARDGSAIGCFAEQKRIRLLENEIPHFLERAIIASEDKNFYSHKGLDPAAIGRAAWNDIWAGKIVEGGSTITQQTAKNYFLSGERSFERKRREALLALSIELFHSKREILTAYVNVIFLGRAYGFEAASRAYFGRSVKDLSLAETAFLVGLINEPSLLISAKTSQKDAQKDMENRFADAVSRKNRVLRLMREQKMISYQEYAQAYWEKIIILPPGEDCKKKAPYFLEDIRKEYKDNLPLLTRGLRIFTGLDLALQKKAEKALENGLARYKARRPENASKVQGAMVVLDAKNAEVLAMVGGENFSRSEFNNATQALRQPGSAFKPIVNAAYMKYVCKKNRELCVFPDVPFPVSMGAGRGMHYVQNYPYRDLPHYRGIVNMDIQLAESRNAATMWMAKEAERAWVGALIPQKLAEHEEKKEERIAHYRKLGYSAAGALREYEEERALISKGVLWNHEERIRWLFELAKNIGINSKLEPYLVTAIGASEVKVLEITAAFMPFFNGGFRTAPSMIRKITDSASKQIFEAKNFSFEPAFVKYSDEDGLLENWRIAENMKELLRGVVDLPTGTAHALRRTYREGDIACKTGTATNSKDEPTDNWIICATPRYIVGIWIGLENKLNMGDRETGAVNALPIFSEFISGLLDPAEKFSSIFSPHPKEEAPEEKPKNGAQNGHEEDTGKAKPEKQQPPQ